MVPGVELSLKHDYCCEANLPSEHDQYNQGKTEAQAPLTGSIEICATTQHKEFHWPRLLRHTK